MNKKKIVILGAGFAGIYAYLRLHKLFHKRSDVQITIVNRHNYFEFRPLIHEVASGGLSRENVVRPIRQMVRCCPTNFLEAEIEAVNLARQEVNTSGGKLPYDYLILALGATDNFFNIPGATEHTQTLKSVTDSAGLRNHLLNTFEQATHEVDKSRRDRLLRTVVIGGGPTGVEIAGELADLVNDELALAYPTLRGQMCKIIILQSRGRVVPQARAEVSVSVLKKLEELGVVVRFKTRAKEITKDGVITDQGIKFSPRLLFGQLVSRRQR